MKSAIPSEYRPISSLQKSMALASMRAPRSGIYLVQEVCDLPEDVDIGLLQQSWYIVSLRYPALRTSIEFSGGEPVRLRLHDRSELLWQERDWTGTPSESQQARLEPLLREDRERGFDFYAGVPMRFCVLHTPRNSSTLIWTSHHALLDGRSYLIVWRDWLALYDALVRDETGFVEHTVEDQSASSPEPPDSIRVERYWRTCFEGLSQTTDYVVDRIRGVAVPVLEAPGKESVRFSRELTRQLRDFARDHHVSLNNLVQGAWALLLSRYSGRSDVVFGVTRAGRSSPPGDEKVGLFINTLPLRILAAPDSCLAPWLNQVRMQWIAMREFEHTPLDEVWKWSGLPPGMPPFESVVVYEHELPGDALRKLGGPWKNRKHQRIQRTDSPLTLTAFGEPVLSIELVFDSRLFCSHTIAGLAGHLKALLESFPAHPNARLSELRLLTEDEERWIVQQNNRSADYPVDRCAHQLFEQQVQRTPRGIALESVEGSISYQELNARSNRLAWYLRQIGARPDDLIAVCMNSSVETVIAVLAVLKAGAAFLPLDPALPQERLVTMLTDAKPKLVLSKTAEGLPPKAGACQMLNVDELQEMLALQPAENLHNAATLSIAAYAIYTSGSTGKPRAVVVPHRALVNHTLAAASVFGIDKCDRRLQFASIGTDMFVAEVFNYLARGATLVLGWNLCKGSVREFFRYLDDNRITITGIPSTWWNECVAALARAEITLPRSLRAVIMGMERANPAAFVAWKELVGTKIRLFNAYGPTETSPTATVYEAGSSAWETASFVPIGKPLANTRAYVLDGYGNPVPAGIIGELHIGGSGLARAYLNSPELTAQKFVPDPFNKPDTRLYRTGDLVFYLPDGNLVFVGRTDRQVKIRGFRVELEEIEAALGAHPAVLQVAVVNAEKGGKNRLVAFHTGHGTRAPSYGDLRLFLAKRLPEHMLPADFIHMDELPMTPAGKIDRQALRIYELADPPERDFDPPSTAMEKRLAAIWKEVLGVSPNGCTDNFFESGADSLDATRLITHIEAEFDREIPLALLWRAPTIARMASLLEGDDSLFRAVQERSAAVPLQPKGSRIPYFCLPGADENPFYFGHLARVLGEDQPFYVLRDPRPMGQRGVYTVEDVAGRLISALKSIQSQGPYIIGGHCYGGIVAFEIARQLVACGDCVAMLILFEVPAPGYPKVLRHWKNYFRQAFSALRGERPVGLDEARQHLGVVTKLFRRKAAVLKRRLLIQAGLIRAIKPLQQLRHPNTQAGLSYQLKSVTCDVIQFIAADERHSTLILDDPRLGWREFTRGTFSVRKTPGTAAAIFDPPHVRELALDLRALLDGVNSAYDTSQTQWMAR